MTDKSELGFFYEEKAKPSLASFLLRREFQNKSGAKSKTTENAAICKDYTKNNENKKGGNLKKSGCRPFWGFEVTDNSER